jgi:hypothetical protein
MARRRPVDGRVTPPGSTSSGDPQRLARPVWIRMVVLVMLLALILSVVAGFVSALE